MKNCNDGKNRIASIDVLRAIAFFSIFLLHSGVANYAAWGVSIFFVLSGFLLMYKDKGCDDDTLNLKNCFLFSVNRIKKLYPLHIITMFMVLLYDINRLINFFDKALIFKDIKYIICNVLLIQSWIPIESVTFSLNGVSWFLSCMFFFYFCYPYIRNYINKMKGIKSAVLNIIAIYIIQIIVATILVYFSNDFKNISIHCLLYSFPLFRIFDFIIGSNLGYIVSNVDNNKKMYKWIYILLAIVLFISQYIYNRTSCPAKDSILVLPGSVLMVLFFSYCRKGRICSILSKIRSLKYIGKNAVYMYLPHQILLAYLFTAFTKLKIEHNVYVQTIGGLFLCIIATELWKYLIHIIHQK